MSSCSMSMIREITTWAGRSSNKLIDPDSIDSPSLRRRYQNEMHIYSDRHNCLRDLVRKDKP